MQFINNLIILAHSWYPRECCSDKDCKPVPCDQLAEQVDGSYLYQGTVFAKEVIKNSHDAMCHVCINYNGQGLCAFILSLT